jgi:small subunit ribosomal protein S11
MGQQKVVDKTKIELEAPPKEIEKKSEKEVKKRIRKKKKEALPIIKRGRAYIQATYNNIIVTITDLRGNVLVWSSAGQVGFKGPKKSTPYAAGVTVKDLAEKAKERGLEGVDVLVKGVGPGREAAIRALNANGIQVFSIKDITPIPHNGPRPPKPRRV